MHLFLNRLDTHEINYTFHLTSSTIYIKEYKRNIKMAHDVRFDVIKPNHRRKNTKLTTQNSSVYVFIGPPSIICLFVRSFTLISTVFIGLIMVIGPSNQLSLITVQWSSMSPQVIDYNPTRFLNQGWEINDY